LTERTLIASATNLLWRGFQVVPTDRRSREARRSTGSSPWPARWPGCAFKEPARAVAVFDPRGAEAWPELLKKQLEPLPELLRALGCRWWRPPTSSTWWPATRRRRWQRATT